tara:strand:+ start:478 stop:1191 length:714 start_codon:yes stop_codon:yes gene_type:complete
MNILLCSIIRNRALFLILWYLQIQKIANNNKDINFSLSVYENDSIDGSPKIISQIKKQFGFNFLDEFYFKTEIINTKYYTSIKNDERVQLLANARNKCIDQVSNLSKFSKIVFIEPDIEYPDKCRKLIKSSYDIISGISIHNQTFYDTWATRLNQHDTELPLNISLDSFENNIINVWSTFNCFCVYNAEPFIKGLRFTGFNNKTKSHDCDTAIICDLFRDSGYTNIAIDKTFVVKHF